MIQRTVRKMLVGTAAALLLAACGAAFGSGGPVEGRASGTVLESAREHPAESLDLIVRFHHDPAPADVESVEAAGGLVTRTLPSIRALAATVHPAELENLLGDPSVAFISMDVPVRANLDVAGEASGAYPSFQPIGSLTGAGVTVAILDSGIGDHHDLAGRVLARVDLIGDGTEAGDPYGHGTHVAGIVAGDGSSSDGFYRGIAPGVTLVSVRVLDETGSGTTSGVIAGIEWAVENRFLHGIRVLNLSLGHPVQESVNDDPLVLAVERAVEAGLVVICSAGNLGAYGNFTVSSPGNAPSAVTTGSATDQNTVDPDDDEVSGFSSAGPSLGDAIAKPDMLAPGNRVISLRAAGSLLDLQHREWRVAYQGQEAYFEMSGTSMAAPMVAAAAAVMLESDPDLDPASVKARLTGSARPISCPDPLACGAGVLNVAGAVQSDVRVQSAASPTVEGAGSGAAVFLQALPADGVVEGE